MNTIKTPSTPVAPGDKTTAGERPWPGNGECLDHANRSDNNLAVPDDVAGAPHDVASEPDDEPEPILKKWTPQASSAQVIHGAARDLAALVSLLIARQRLAVEFEASHKSIRQTRQLTRALRDLTHIVKETTPGKSRS